MFCVEELKKIKYNNNINIDDEIFLNKEFLNPSYESRQNLKTFKQEKKSFEIIPLEKYYFNKDIIIIETNLGNIKIQQNWYKKFNIFNQVESIFEKIKIDENEQLIPNIEDVFNFTLFTNFENITHIFIGQDPYQDINLATGIAFAINHEKINQIPKSMKILYKKLQNQTSEKRVIEDWFFSGNFFQYTNNILFLNLGLTIGITKSKKNNYIQKNINSHIKFWKQFTKKLVLEIYLNNPDIKIICLGSEAKKVFSKTNINKNNILYDLHPAARTLPANYFDNPIIFDNNMIFKIKA